MKNKKQSCLDISEKDFIAQIIELAHVFGWLCAHFRAAQTTYGWRTPVQGDGKGFLDLLLIHPGRGEVMTVEVKSEKGKMTPDQVKWFKAWQMTTCQVYLFRPSDWDKIVEILKG